MDAGDRWMLNNVAGKPLRAWNDRETRYDVPTPPKGHVMRTVYDALQRPTHLYMQATGAAEILVERLVYGEGHPEALQLNLKGKPFQHYDGAGVVSNWEFDFKGNLLRGSRQLAKDYKQLVDWMVLADLTEIAAVVQAAIALLETKTFDSSTIFDGMNHPTMMTMPDRSIIYPIHNEANLLEKVEVQLRGAVARTVFVKDINYDAKGQRQSIEYDSGVKTAYSYDRDTFRLTQLLTTRQDANVSTRLQDLNYTYDPVGNITTIRDDAQQTVYFNGEVVSPSTQYEYDALYRLIRADGREHIGQTTSQPPETNPGLKPAYDSNDWTRRNLAHRNQGEAMRNYTEAYEYDAVGNILAMIHAAGDVGSWRRDYNYAATNNRLLSTTVPGSPNVGQSLVNYDYDTHGNMIEMPHLPLMRWDFKDQLQATSQQVRNDGGTPEITYYVYDASGQRVRKVTEGQAAAGDAPKRMNERIYLGGFEVYREYSGSSDSVKLERETLHVMDDQQRIALVETKTVTNPDDESPTQLIRFQFGNHLGSASLELDDKGRVISYEEYYPYGSTAYHAVDKGIKAAGKRYRYTGMERDDETGLSYHSARYYVPWLGRWVSADPAGLVDGVNIYRYCANNPIIFHDPNGKETIVPGKATGKETPEEIKRIVNAQGYTYTKDPTWDSGSKRWDFGDDNLKPSNLNDKKTEKQEGKEKKEKKKSEKGEGKGKGEEQNSVQRDGWFSLPSWAVKAITVAAIVTAVVAVSLIVLNPAIIAGGLRFAGMAFNALSRTGTTATAIGGGAAGVTTLIQNGINVAQGTRDLAQSGTNLAQRAGGSSGTPYAISAPPSPTSPPTPGQIIEGGSTNFYSSIFGGHAEQVSGTFTVPEGTYLEFPVRSGQGLNNADALLIESSGINHLKRNIFSPGQTVPEHILYPQNWFNPVEVGSGETTVTTSTYLSDLIESNMGLCLFNACRSIR
jgi:RHS repeat-associated protein